MVKIYENLLKLHAFQTYTDKTTAYFRKIRDYLYLNGEKNRSKNTKFHQSKFSVLKIEIELLVFLERPYDILERLIILFAKSNFIGFLSH